MAATRARASDMHIDAIARRDTIDTVGFVLFFFFTAATRFFTPEIRRFPVSHLILYDKTEDCSLK